MNFFHKTATVLMAAAALSSAKTIVLQQGLDGYTGVKDTWIVTENQYSCESEFGPPPYGDCETFFVSTF